MQVVGNNNLEYTHEFLGDRRASPSTLPGRAVRVSLGAEFPREPAFRILELAVHVGVRYRRICR